jgi:hypothetical protein
MRGSPGWNLVDYRGIGFQFMEGLTLFLGANPWHSESTKYFDLRKLDHEGSWLVFPPKRSPWEEMVIPTDEDLQVRYQAGKPVFGLLIGIALRILESNDQKWLDAMATACALPDARQILNFMGIKGVRHLRDIFGYREPCILFECGSYGNNEYRVSKGYSCLSAPPSNTHNSLNAEPEAYVVGEPAFRELDDSLFIFYLREK